MATLRSFSLPTGLNPDTQTKLEMVMQRLYGLGSVLVAFSGGVDSALVLKAAVEATPGKVLAATGLSASYADEEIAEAKSVAAQLGAAHQMVNTMELTDPRYADNTHQRCFFCKSELYTQLGKTAEQLGYAAVVDGTNADDQGDFRPGIRAADQLGVISPLAEAGMTKREIREVAKAWGVPIWTNRLPRASPPDSSMVTRLRLRSFARWLQRRRCSEHLECGAFGFGTMKMLPVSKSLPIICPWSWNIGSKSQKGSRRRDIGLLR